MIRDTANLNPLETSTNEILGVDINHILSNMTQAEKLGQLIMLDFRDWTVDGKQVPFTVMNDQVGQVIGEYKIGGVILFRENLVNTEQTVRLTHGLQKAVRNNIPLMIAVDQEGGLVTRLQTGTNMPGNMALAATRDVELTREVAKAIGEEIKSVGFNVNFAPVIDVNSNYRNPVIGIRSFGSDAELVSEMGVAYLKGLQDAKVAATAKHFPGHGDTATDSHVGLPSVHKTLEELQAVDLKPFQASVDAGVDVIMTAHLVVPSLDDGKLIAKDGREMGNPATLSKKILTGLLRDEMHYDGVIITDALNMKAISDHFTEAEAVVRTFAAGADIALMPTNLRAPEDTGKLTAIFEAIQRAITVGVLSQEQIDQSVRRVLSVKKKHEIMGSEEEHPLNEKIADALRSVGSVSHKKIEGRAAEKAITLIKNEGDILPFKLANHRVVLILASSEARANLMELQLHKIIKRKNLEGVLINRYIYAPETTLNADDKERIELADFIVMETMNVNQASRYAPEVVAYANDSAVKLAVMSTRNPYDIMFMEEVKALIAVYGSSGYDQTQDGESALPINIPVGMEVLFGVVKPSGRLPVSIPKAKAEGILYEFGHGLTFRHEKATTAGSNQEIIS